MKILITFALGIFSFFHQSITPTIAISTTTETATTSVFSSEATTSVADSNTQNVNICEKEYGTNSLNSGGAPACECAHGYAWNNEYTKCVTPTVACSEINANWDGKITNSEAECNSCMPGYVPNSAGTACQISNVSNPPETTTNLEQDCLNNVMQNEAQMLQKSNAAQKTSILSINDQLQLNNEAMYEENQIMAIGINACKAMAGQPTTPIQSTPDQQYSETNSSYQPTIQDTTGQNNTNIYGVIYALDGSTVSGNSGNYSRVGDTIYTPGGATYSVVGDTIYGPGGVTYSLVGNTLYGPGGTTYNLTGNKIQSSDGSSASKVGDTIYIQPGN